MLKQTMPFLAVGLIASAIYSTSSHAAANTVYSVTSAPLMLEETVKVSTITKGYTAANQAVYKPMVQTVKKSAFKTALKGSLLLAPTPYTIGLLVAMEAYDYYLDGDQVTQTTEVVNGASCYSTILYDYGSGNCLGLMPSKYNARAYKGESSGWYIKDSYSYGETASIIYYQVTMANDNLDGKTYTDSMRAYQPNHVEESKPITDDQFLSFYENYVNSNPDIDHKNLFLNASGQVNPEFFPDPQFELNTVAEQVNADLYGSGLLQQTDPGADNYASPEAYAEAKKLWESQNLTPEQQAQALNEGLEQPITQEQYASEQDLIESRAEEKMKSSAALLDALDIKPNDYTTASQENLDNTLELLNTTADLPTSDFNNYLNFTTSETCKTVPFPFIGQFPNSAQCEKLGTVKDFLGYFLSILLMWNIINTVLKEAN